MFSSSILKDIWDLEFAVLLLGHHIFLMHKDLFSRLILETKVSWILTHSIDGYYLEGITSMLLVLTEVMFHTFPSILSYFFILSVHDHLYKFWRVNFCYFNNNSFKTKFSYWVASAVQSYVNLKMKAKSLKIMVSGWYYFSKLYSLIF